MAFTIDDVKEAIIEAIKEAFEDKIVPSLKSMGATLKSMEATLESIRAKLESMEAKLENSLAGREEELKWPPHKVTGEPYVTGESININCLLVAGNEKLPNGKPNTWNKAKTREALEYYGEECESDEEKSEYSEISRARRLLLARVLGVSRAQLNFAQLAL